MELRRLVEGLRAGKVSEVLPRLLLVAMFTIHLLRMAPRRIPLWLAAQQARLDTALNSSRDYLSPANID
jgi:hypothetical protein